MDYRKHKGLNQSSLKKILQSPTAYQKEINRTEESLEEHFVFGSLLDFMMLEKEKDFEDEYYIISGTMGSEAIQNIVKYVYDRHLLEEKECDLNTDAHNTILKGAMVYGYGGKWKQDTIVNKIIKEGLNYYNSLKKAEGKIIITQEDHSKALICKAALLSDPYTAKYFTAGKDIEIIDKKVIKFEHLGHHCKGELDKLVIHHGQKWIIPADLKTTGTGIYAFNTSFWKYGYDFQAAFYTLGVQLDPEIKKLLDKGYTLKNFKFIVIETDVNSQPFVFNTPQEVLNIGMNGGKLANGWYREGVTQAFTRLEYHMSNDQWLYPMEYLNEDVPGELNIKL